MILLDALYINSGGGKILLDYLIKELEKNDFNVYYLLDKRCKGDYPNVSTKKKKFIKASLYNRYRFYKKHGKQFKKVFCFGNLAPPIKLDAITYTYLQQKLYIAIPKSLGYSERIKFLLKKAVFQFLSKNTNYWIVQSTLMKNKLISNNITEQKCIYCIPFYPDIKADKVNQIERQKRSYIYASSGASHKNHLVLFKGFKLFYDKFRTGVLHVTISDSFPNLIDAIKEYNIDGYPIINHGFVDQKYLSSLYYTSEYTIYPSLSESLGLGVIEAIEHGCKVIGANLEYMYEVCRPSIVFSPEKPEDISEALINSLDNNIPATKKKITNKIDYLLEILK